METVKKYNTHTDQRWYAAYTAAISLILGIVGAVGMWLWLRIIGPSVMVFGVCFLMMIIMGLSLMRQRNIKLDFVDDKLYIHHTDGQYYEIYDVPASDFVCSQNFLEKKQDVGRIKVKGTIFYFYGVRNYAETCRYIQENFPNF